MFTFVSWPPSIRHTAEESPSGKNTASHVRGREEKPCSCYLHFFVISCSVVSRQRATALLICCVHRAAFGLNDRPWNADQSPSWRLTSTKGTSSEKWCQWGYFHLFFFPFVLKWNAFLRFFSFHLCPIIMLVTILTDSASHWNVSSFWHEALQLAHVSSLCFSVFLSCWPVAACLPAALSGNHTYTALMPLGYYAKLCTWSLNPLPNPNLAAKPDTVIIYLEKK